MRGVEGYIGEREVILKKLIEFLLHIKEEKKCTQWGIGIIGTEII